MLVLIFRLHVVPLQQNRRLLYHMDESRLAMVIRREELNRKFVFNMNGIVLTNLNVQNRYLKREHDETTAKLRKNRVNVSTHMA